MSNKKVKAQMRIFKELEDQLLIQAERVGVREDYSPMHMREVESDALQKHLIAFYQERLNLEYEMQMLGTDKKEVLIKLERLEVYISRAERMAQMYEKEMAKLLERLTPDKEKVEKAIAARSVAVIGGVN
jgi:predicted nuclease with TOPRIM domain